MRYALSVFAIVITVGVLARIFFFASYVNSGWAMLPSIWPGDFIFAVQWPVKNLKRGDVVALRCPGSKAQLCLKRVVGLPGDRLEFQSGNVSVNGQPAKHIPISPQVFQESLLGESWLIWPDESTDLFAEPVVVPPRQVYLLNDKRSVWICSKLRRFESGSAWIGSIPTRCALGQEFVGPGSYVASIDSF